MSRLFEQVPVYVGERAPKPTKFYEFDNEGKSYVYTLRFETWDDESFRTNWPLVELYVGLTKMPLSAKLYAHRAGSSNKKVGARMQQGNPESVRIIKLGYDRHMLRYVELSEIHSHHREHVVDPRFFLLNKLNSPLGFNPKTHVTPHGQCYCSTCYRVLSKDEFYKDCTRGTGVSSKCKDCSKTWWQLYSEAKKNGTSTSHAYRKLKTGA